MNLKKSTWVTLPGLLWRSMDIAREELVAAIQSDGPEAEDIQLLCDLFNSLKKEIISSPEKKAREEVANRTEQTPVPIALELQSEAKSRLQNRFDYCKERFCKDTGIVLHYDGDISYLRKAWLLLKKGYFCAGCDGTLYCQDHLNVSSSSAGCSRSTKAAYTHFELEHKYVAPVPLIFDTQLAFLTYYNTHTATDMPKLPTNF